MMLQSVGFLLILVLSGYWFRSRTTFRRLDFLASSNYVIFYESAIAGGVFFGFFWVLCGLVKIALGVCEPEDLVTASVCQAELGYPFQFADALFATVLFSYAIPVVQGKYSDVRGQLKAAAKDWGLIPTLILEAMDESTLIELTTSRRKSYIGWVIRGPDIASKGKMLDVAILPLHSGFRDESDLTLHLTTEYTDALNNILTNIKKHLVGNRLRTTRKGK